MSVSIIWLSKRPTFIASKHKPRKLMKRYLLTLRGIFQNQIKYNLIGILIYFSDPNKWPGFPVLIQFKCIDVIVFINIQISASIICHRKISTNHFCQPPKVYLLDQSGKTNNSLYIRTHQLKSIMSQSFSSCWWHFAFLVS